ERYITGEKGLRAKPSATAGTPTPSTSRSTSGLATANSALQGKDIDEKRTHPAVGRAGGRGDGRGAHHGRRRARRGPRRHEPDDLGSGRRGGPPLRLRGRGQLGWNDRAGRSSREQPAHWGSGEGVRLHPAQRDMDTTGGVDAGFQFAP